MCIRYFIFLFLHCTILFYHKATTVPPQRVEYAPTAERIASAEPKDDPPTRQYNNNNNNNANTSAMNSGKVILSREVVVYL